MKKKILIVDDEPHMRKLAEFSLRKGGYQFVFGEDGEEALTLSGSEQPDLIVMDVKMPQMDGLAALRQLRLLPGICSIPVIVVTGLGSLHSNQARRDTGADAVIMKPYSPSRLLATARKLLSA